jgi:hypothetical protein
MSRVKNVHVATKFTCTVTDMKFFQIMSRCVKPVIQRTSPVFKDLQRSGNYIYHFLQHYETPHFFPAVCLHILTTITSYFPT